jgi:glycerol-3-phosphate acyltransferase PlsY
MRLLGVALLAYLAGSINFAIVVLRLSGRGDPRSWSSGNPGTFNVYRKMGVRWAAPIFLLDLGRAAFVAAAALKLLPYATAPWAALALLAGNRYPLFHAFRGGKGVANYLGFTAVVAPIAAAVSLVAWVIFNKIGREAFIGSFAMIAVLGAGTLIRCGVGPWTVVSVVAALALIVYGHRHNIAAKWGGSATVRHR